MEFDIWFKSVDALCVTRGLFGSGDQECWREDFEKGMTPQEAFDSDSDLYAGKTRDKLSTEQLKKYSLAANKEVASMADELISLRGLGDVPVAIWEIVNPGEGTYFSIHDPRPEDEVRATYGKLPLTASQKPVVLPEGFCDNDGGWVIDYAETVAAIEAAGGKVAE